MYSSVMDNYEKGENDQRLRALQKKGESRRKHRTHGPEGKSVKHCDWKRREESVQGGSDWLCQEPDDSVIAQMSPGRWGTDCKTVCAESF